MLRIRPGNLWLGGIGAVRIARGGLRTYSQQDGLEAPLIGAILEDRDGRLCVVTQSARGRPIHFFDGRRFHAVPARFPEIP